MFLYLYDYSMCTAYFEQEIIGMNLGVTDIKVEGAAVTVLGYNLNADQSITELLYVVSAFPDPLSGGLLLMPITTFTATISNASKTTYVDVHF